MKIFQRKEFSTLYKNISKEWSDLFALFLDTFVNTERNGAFSWLIRILRNNQETSYFTSWKEHNEIN